jgi:hypothetical protein
MKVFYSVIVGVLLLFMFHDGTCPDLIFSRSRKPETSKDVRRGQMIL